MRIFLLLSAVVAFFPIAGCTLFDVDIDVMGPRGPLRETTVREGEKAHKVLLLRVEGVITDTSRSRILSRFESPVALLKERLKKAREDPYVRAVVLRVSSPGGTVTASDIMCEEIKRFRKETGIPVIACFMDIATSGGYYVAMSADKIVCHPTCITGSIGVVAQLTNLEALLEKIGIEHVTIKSGKHKDIGSPLREPTAQEKEIMQVMVQSLYDRFVDVVAAGRGMERDKVLRLADGRVYDAKQALALGLVDRVGYLDDAIELAQQDAGITGASVVMYRRPAEYASTIYSAEAKPDGNLLVERLLGSLGARFFYLWIPGR